MMRGLCGMKRRKERKERLIVDCFECFRDGHRRGDRDTGHLSREGSLWTAVMNRDGSRRQEAGDKGR